jgi:hypothetical protein
LTKCGAGSFGALPTRPPRFNAELAQKSKSLACINKTSALTVGRDRPSIPSDGQADCIPSDGQADCLSVSCVKRRRTEVTVSSNGSQRPSVGKNLPQKLNFRISRGSRDANFEPTLSNLESHFGAFLAEFFPAGFATRPSPCPT